MKRKRCMLPVNERMEKLKKSLQYSIGILFMLSGFLKALDSQTFSALIMNYGLWGGFGYLVPFISGAEVLLGLFLILNIRTRSTALITAILTFIFTIAFAYAFFARGIEDCGCMGNFISIPPAISFARNIFIMAGCLWILRSHVDKKSDITGWKSWTILAIACVTFLLAGYSMAAPIIGKNKIHKGDHLNTRLFSFFDKSVFRGRTVIFIFSPTCSHCWNATENVKSIKRMPEFSNLIGVTFNDADLSGYTEAMQPNFEVINYPTPELYDVIREVPILLILENGKVERIFKSQEIPCGEMLQRMLAETK